MVKSFFLCTDWVVIDVVLEASLRAMKLYGLAAKSMTVLDQLQSGLHQVLPLQLNATIFPQSELLSDVSNAFRNDNELC